MFNKIHDDLSTLNAVTNTFIRYHYIFWLQSMSQNLSQVTSDLMWEGLILVNNAGDSQQHTVSDKSSLVEISREEISKQYGIDW